MKTWAPVHQRGRRCEGGRRGGRGRVAGAGDAVERRDLTGGLAEVFDGMGDGLAEWIVTAPGGAQMMLGTDGLTSTGAAAW